MGVSLTSLPETNLLKGFLDNTPLAFLLGAARVWNATGTLSLRRDQANKQIYFLEGLPVYCKSDLAGESLRQVMLKAGKIDNETLARVQECMENENVEEDRALLELGVLNDSTRYFHLQEQTTMRILDCFEWATGQYYFLANEGFLDHVELFDIDPLSVIHEGISTHQILDIAGMVQEAAMETVELAEDIETFNPFIGKFFSESKIEWPEINGKSLGSVIPYLNPDITKSLYLAFILISTGGLLLGGRRSGELNPPPSIRDIDEKSSEESEQSEDAFLVDPWGGGIESPNLDDEDGDVSGIVVDKPEKPQKKKPPKPPRPPKGTGFRTPQKATPLRPRKKKTTPPPPEPPWKRKERLHREEMVRRKAAGPNAGASPGSVPGASPVPSRESTGTTDSSVERRFLRMLEVVRSGNPFEILDIAEEDDRAEIKKAYFYRNSQFHQDNKNALGPNGDSIVNEVHEGLRNAYDILLDPAKKYEYQMQAFVEEKQKAWSLDLRKKLAKTQFKRGLWYLSQRHPELAHFFFDAAASLDAEQASYYTFLGWSQYMGKHDDSAACMAFIRTALGINPHYSEAHLFLGWISKDIGREKESIEFFEQALEHNPQNVFARQELEKSGPIKKKTEGDGLLKRFLKK